MDRVAFLIILVIFLSSCESESPAPAGNQNLPEKPAIAMLNVAPSSETLDICGENDPNAIALSSADTLKLTINLKALYGLSQYKIDIHSNFDCHAHGRMAQDVGVPWQVLEVQDVEGYDVTVDKNLSIPSDVQAGNYHFMLQALDLKGNEAEWVLYSLKVTNETDTEKPVITFIDPSTDSISVAIGETIDFKMNITDNQDLFGGRVDVTYLNSSNTEFTADQYYFPENAGSEIMYDFSFAFPSSPASGDYTFIAKVYDALGNEVEKRLIVHIEE